MTPSRTRRLAIAALVSATVFVSVAAAAGMSGGGPSSSGEMPATFTLASRMAGDKGTWEITFAEAASVSSTSSTVQTGGGDGPRSPPIAAQASLSAGQVTVVEHFEWLPEEAWQDGSGAWHAVHGLLSVNPDFGSTATIGDRTVFTPEWEILWYETSTGRILGSTELAGGGAAASSGLSGSDEVTSVFVFTAWKEEEPCSLGSRLREGVSLEDEIQVTGCGNGVAAFRAVGVEVLDDIAAVRFDATGPSGSTSYWFNPAIPEPLRFATTTADGTPRGERRLVSFERGGGAWDTGIKLPTDQVMPKIDLAPRQPWGPDDSGVEHPFPLSAAWQKAASDLAFRDFGDYLAGHPDAAAWDADYSEERQGSTTYRVWRMLVISDGEPFYLVAKQTEQYVGGPATDLFGIPPAGPPVATYEFSTGSASVSGITNDDLPKQLPTVASGLAYWQALTGDAEPGNAWGLDSCFACHGPGRSLKAGRDLFDRPATPILGSTPDPTIVSSFVILDETGRPTGLWRQDSEYVRTAGGLLGKGPGSGMESSVAVLAGHPFTVATLGAVAIPVTTTAGASFLAVLVGLLVWFWPALKGLPFLGLFSRVREDKLLEHPVRRRVMDQVEAQPGIHYQELLRAMGGGKGSLEHHLRKLEEGRLVRAVRGPRYTCYFPWSANAASRDEAPALKSDGARRVFAAVQAHPGITGQDLAARTGLSASSVSEHVSRLAAAGLVRSSREGRTVRVQPARQAAGAF